MNQILSTTEAAQLLINDEFANWSRAGAFALAEYLEELELSKNYEIQFDAIALRCDYSEFECLKDWIKEYYGEDLQTAIKSAGIDLEGDEEEEEVNELIRSHILDHGELIEFNSGIIVSSF